MDLLWKLLSPLKHIVHCVTGGPLHGKPEVELSIDELFGYPGHENYSSRNCPYLVSHARYPASLRRGRMSIVKPKLEPLHPTIQNYRKRKYWEEEDAAAVQVPLLGQEEPDMEIPYHGARLAYLLKDSSLTITEKRLGSPGDINESVKSSRG